MINESSNNLEVLSFERMKGEFLLSQNRFNFGCFADELVNLDRDFDCYDQEYSDLDRLATPEERSEPGYYSRQSWDGY